MCTVVYTEYMYVYLLTVLYTLNMHVHYCTACTQYVCSHCTAYTPYIYLLLHCVISIYMHVSVLCALNICSLLYYTQSIFSTDRAASAESDREDFEGSYPPSKADSHLQSKQDMSQASTSSLLDQSVRDLLITARNILELGLKNVSSARQAVALNDGKSIADTSWCKVGRVCKRITICSEI